MKPSRDFVVHRLARGEAAMMRELLAVFGEVFSEMETYTGAQPQDAYLDRLLGSATFIALTALKNGRCVGGLAAYVLPKFEQERSEVYIYDLAVAAEHRRQGIATALIQETGRIAAECGAYVVFVQADYDDAPAIALYSKLGVRQDAAHFDIRL